jgi:predicted nucleic acid-binding protein
MNVFLDTNVLMDVLLERKPFAAASRKVWFLAERGKISGLVSALTFPNIYYIVRKVRGLEAATAMMTMLRDTFVPVALDEQILQQAMDAKFSDFEDAIQYFSALRSVAVCLVTRNPAHFPCSTLPVLSPAGFLAAHDFE